VGIVESFSQRIWSQDDIVPLPFEPELRTACYICTQIRRAQNVQQDIHEFE
jgi:hypothetical protein